MHVVCRDGTRVKGYGAYLHVAASLPPLWPLLPVAALPGIRAVGEAVYARLAATRPRRAAAPCAVPLGRSACVGLTPTQLAVVVLVCTLQASASLARLELDPLMSDYPMYSDTYASTVDFDRVVGNPSFIGQWNGRREDLTAVLGRLGLDEVVRDALLEANQEGITNNTAGRLKEVSELLERNTGIKFDRLELLADRRAFDWTSGRFYWKSRSEVVAALDLRTLD